MSRKKKKSGGSEGDSQAWLATFSDLNFLMITFFVLLLSMSSMDQRAYSDMFGEEISSSEESLRPEPPMGRSPMPAIYPARGSFVGENRELPADPEAGTAGRSKNKGTGMMNQETSSPLSDPDGRSRDEILRRALTAVKDLVTLEDVNDGEIHLSVDDSIFFEDNEYRPSPQATEVLRSIGELANDLDGNLMVQAHRGDWHIAAKRSAIVAMLLAQRHVPGQRIAADVIAGPRGTLNFAITRTRPIDEQPENEEQE